MLLLKILQFSFYFLMTFDLAIDLYCLGVILVYKVRPPPALSIEFKVPAKFWKSFAKYPKKKLDNPRRDKKTSSSKW